MERIKLTARQAETALNDLIQEYKAIDKKINQSVTDTLINCETKLALMRRKEIIGSILHYIFGIQEDFDGIKIV